ncbi:MAG: choice-of-anchor J domain-containing protein [Bacteroidales bacterium]|nr:choice-of-anchor J domain-containing protein [Bacteroidales bacterium]
MKPNHLSISLLGLFLSSVQAAPVLEIVKLETGTSYITSLRQAEEIRPAAVITNIGTSAAVNDTVTFQIPTTTWSCKVPIPNINVGDTLILKVPQGSGYTATTAKTYQVKATVAAATATVTSSFQTTQNRLSQYRGPVTGTLGIGTPVGQYGNIYRLNQSDVISKATIDFALWAQGQFPILDFTISVFSIDELTKELTKVYTTPTLTRPRAGSATVDFAFSTPLLSAGLYLITADQLNSEPLFITGDASDEGLYSVSGNNLVDEGKGALCISFYTSQVESLTPARDAKVVPVSTPVSLTFFTAPTLSHSNYFQISPNPGGISASVSDKTINVAHNTFNYNTRYRVRMLADAISNQWDTVTWYFTTQMDPSSCNAPTDLSVQDIQTNQANITWIDNNPAITQWDIIYGVKGFNISTEGTFIQNLNSQSYILQGLDEGKQYDFYVRSHCPTASNSAWSAKYTFRTARTSVDLQVFDHTTATVGNHTYEAKLISFSSNRPDIITNTSYIKDGTFRNGEYINGTLYALTRAGIDSDSILLYDKNGKKLKSIRLERVFNDVAYDYSTGTLYGVSGTSSTGGVGTLCTVNIETGTVQELGQISPPMSGLACDISGQLYGISNAEGTLGNLFAINKSTRATTFLFNTNYTPNGLQSLMFDHNTERLFWLLNTTTTIPTGTRLLEIDLSDYGVIDYGFVGVGTVGRYNTLYSYYDIATDVIPARYATKVAENTPVSVTFNIPVTTENLSGITIYPAISSFTPSLNGNTITIAHSDFAFNTTYTVSIPTSSGLYSWSFTTKLDPDGCHQVDSISVFEVGYNEAKLSWTDYGKASGWQIKVGEGDFDPNFGGTIFQAFTNKGAHVTNLPDGEELTAYIRTVCDSTSGFETYGAWSNPARFTTMLDCRATITEFPYFEGFETQKGTRCWISTNSAYWLRNTTTGVANAHTGNFIYRSEAQDGEAAFITPRLDITGLNNNPVVDFWYMTPIDNSGVFDILNIYYRNSENGEWIWLWGTDNFVNEWTRKTVFLPNGSDHYYIAFESVNFNGYGVSIDDVSIHEFNVADVAVSKIQYPVSGHDHTSTESVTIDITNNGSAAVSNYTVGYMIDGVLKDCQALTQNIPSLGTYTYNFPTKADLTAEKIYTIKAFVNMAGDSVSSNDTLVAQVRNFTCSPSHLPWLTGFEDVNENECWLTISNNYENSNIDNYGFGVLYANGQYVWRFSSYYEEAVDYNQYLITPQMPVTSNNKSITFRYNIYMPQAVETFRVGYSTTDDDISNFIWSEPVTITGIADWRTYSQRSIPANAKYLAINYCPQSSQYYLYIDDVRVGEAAATDAEITSIANPASGPNLTNAETVQAVVTNYGTANITTLSLTLYFDGDSITTETFTQNIAPLTSYTCTFAHKLDLSAERTYQIKVKVSLNGDVITSNDTLAKEVIHYNCTYNFPWTENFEWEKMSECWSVTTADDAFYNWTLSTYLAHSGSKSILHQYSTGTIDHRLVSPAIVMPNETAYKLVFWSYNQFAESYEKAGSENSVWVHVVGTPDQDWVKVWNAETVSEAWVKDGISLAAYKGQTIQVAFKYAGNFAHSWYLDDISLETMPAFDATLAAISKPASTEFNMSSAEQVSIVIRNNGEQTLKNFNATLRLDGVFIATETITDSIVSGATLTYTFNAKLDLSLPGKTYTVGVSVSVLSDAYPSDNALSKNIQVLDCGISADHLPLNFGFEMSSWPISCWTLIDNDGDGYNWDVGTNSVNAHSGRQFGYSESYMIIAEDLQFPLTPDNWLITPPIEIPAARGAELTYYAGAADPNFYREHYEIMISTTGRDISDFEPVYDETLMTNLWQRRTVPLTDYKGQTIYIAFVHNKCTAQFGLLLDDISVSELFNREISLNEFVDFTPVMYGNTQPVQVVLANNGEEILTATTINWKIDGTLQPAMQWSGSLAKGETTTVTLNAAYEFADGAHTLWAAAHIDSDEKPENDTVTYAFEIYKYKTIPYTTEFNGSLDEWKSVTLSGEINFTWANQPYPLIPLNSPTRSNGYAIYDLVRNGLGGPFDALTALVSPEFDFSNVLNSQSLGMDFFHWVRNGPGQTTIRVQASTDRFESDIRDIWTWSSTTVDEILEGKQQIILNSLRGLTGVALRFLYNGDEAFGWGIDDIHIDIVSTQNELSILFAEPVHTLNRQGDNVQFTATVVNNGTATQRNVPVTFRVNGQDIVSTIPNIAYGESKQMTATWNNAAAGEFYVTVSVPDDEDNTNNNLTFVKYVANPYQLAAGFEESEILDDWAMSGDIALTSSLSDDFTAIAPFVYDGGVSMVAGAISREAFDDVLLVTPLLNISDGDYIVFYSKYLNIPAYGTPDIQVIYSADLSSWRVAGDLNYLTDDWKAYKVMLPEAGSFYVALACSSPLSNTGSITYIAIDHIIAPPVENFYNVTFTVTSYGVSVENAVITLNGNTNSVGEYTFGSLAPGVYEYSVSKVGAVTAVGTVAVINQDVYKDVQLFGVGNENITMFDGTVSIAPNPVRDKPVEITVAGNTGSVDVEVCDMLGKIHISKTFTGSTFTLDLTVAPSGMLLVKVSTGSGNNVVRIVKL